MTGRSLTPGVAFISLRISRPRPSSTSTSISTRSSSVELAAATPGNGNATRYKALAAGLRGAMLAKMWNASTGAYCDGVCADPKIEGLGGPYSDMYSLYLGLVPPAAAPAVWDRMAAYTAPNMSSYGDYGAFAVQFSLSDFDLFPGSGGGDVEAKDFAKFYKDMGAGGLLHLEDGGQPTVFVEDDANASARRVSLRNDNSPLAHP